MKLPLRLQFVLIFLSIAIAGFDRHFVDFTHGEPSVFSMEEAFPTHIEIPAKTFDYHEDITARVIFHAIPSPVEFSVHNYRIFHISVPYVSLLSLWQPPEKRT